ncbi:MAG: stress response translation initiation inhibitor YciH [Euryarchaeota archaeon CG01_land_8_20_14_3_00_38_12]|nr:MAG: stress response translation initiation inhibitor YciH [Euryarchaeota archaeon CG01_land_8_20_14_3_00_38_12]PJB22365.1 MAG: stress response translation initiation inhibitor YciH [Euryarchaeota archaeon CG_4_9_14_3_um_filter_38_12]
MAEICPICGLPKELCVCEEIAREQQKIKIYTEKRRYGKTVTIVEGIKSDIDINELAKTLKTKCASGGTVKNGNIELQGDHKKKVQEALMKIGFNAETR